MFDPVDTRVAALTGGTKQGRSTDRTLFAIVLLAILTLAGAWALLPTTDEKAAGLFDDARYGDAIDVLTTAGQQNGLSGYGSQMLFKLYVLTKQRDRAAALLENGLAVDAAAPQRWQQLGELYREARDIPGEAHVLRRLYDLDADPVWFGRLLGLYRLLGDGVGEATLLTQALSLGHAAPSYRDRLAFLRSASAGEDTALWVAPNGRFSFLAQTNPHSTAALQNLAPLTQTSFE